jgi:hypothetical protein
VLLLEPDELVVGAVIRRVLNDRLVEDVVGMAPLVQEVTELRSSLLDVVCGLRSD